MGFLRRMRGVRTVMKRMIWITATLILLAVAFFFVSNSRAATETAPYKVLQKDGDFEVRMYESMRLAKVSLPTSSAASQNMDGSFMKLFRFIDGQNERSEKIAMTTPVLVQRGEAEASMSFVMPQASVAQGLPAPKGEVKLDTLPAVKIVALKFSGVSSRDREAKELAQLQAWALKQGLVTEGDAFYAYYDPPWTPGFMRRNEVLLRVKSK